MSALPDGACCSEVAAWEGTRLLLVVVHTCHTAHEGPAHFQRRFACARVCALMLAPTSALPTSEHKHARKKKGLPDWPAAAGRYTAK